MLAAAEGRLAEHAAPRFSDRNAMTVVIAAEGYPAAPQKGGTITGIDTAEEAGARVFQAGTAEQDGRSEEHTSELPSLMRISYAACCLNKHSRNKDPFVHGARYCHGDRNQP